MGDYEKPSILVISSQVIDSVTPLLMSGGGGGGGGAGAGSSEAVEKRKSLTKIDESNSLLQGTITKQMVMSSSCKREGSNLFLIDVTASTAAENMSGNPVNAIHKSELVLQIKGSPLPYFYTSTSSETNAACPPSQSGAQYANREERIVSLLDKAISLFTHKPAVANSIGAAGIIQNMIICGSKDYTSDQQVVRRWLWPKYESDIYQLLRVVVGCSYPTAFSLSITYREYVNEYDLKDLVITYYINTSSQTVTSAKSAETDNTISVYDGLGDEFSPSFDEFGELLDEAEMRSRVVYEGYKQDGNLDESSLAVLKRNKRKLERYSDLRERYVQRGRADFADDLFLELKAVALSKEEDGL